MKCEMSKHADSTLDEFLDEEGILAEAEALDLGRRIKIKLGA